MRIAVIAGTSEQYKNLRHTLSGPYSTVEWFHINNIEDIRNKEFDAIILTEKANTEFLIVKLR